MKPVAIVLGTYNRLACLQRAIASIRASVGAHPYCIVVCDGGSTDGTWRYLDSCRDVMMLHAGLDGAVKAFNAGFAWAVEQRFPYIMHLNDDAEIVTAADDPDYCSKHPIVDAIDVMEDDPTLGEVAFAIDLRGDWGFECINRAPYANFGIVRREAGMEVARTWDPAGEKWWNPIYRTYGADCEFGARMWQLGWTIYPCRSLRVHDVNHQDELRVANTGNNKNGDADLFWSRWRDVDLVKHVPPHIQQIVERRTPSARGRGRAPKPNPEYKR